MVCCLLFNNSEAAEVPMAPSSLLFFTKYVFTDQSSTEDDDKCGEDGPVKHFAWLRQRRFVWWESLLHLVNWMRPVEGELWLNVEVEPLLKNSVGDHGAVHQAPVTLFDCDPELALYANPFTRLYEVSL